MSESRSITVAAMLVPPGFNLGQWPLVAAHDAARHAIADLDGGQVLAAIVVDARDVAIVEAAGRRVVRVEQHALRARLVAHGGEVRELGVQEVRAGGSDQRQRITSASSGSRGTDS